jgi:acyl-CoA synthetase (AMP-forming)/AMP-acid ligase II
LPYSLLVHAPEWTVSSVLRDMAHRARDSAHLHEVHGGEEAEVEKWSKLAARWEKRAAELAKIRATSQSDPEIVALPHP